MQRVEAEYSDQARNAGMEGTVVLSVIIDSSGAVCDPVVIASLGSGLNEKAIESVSQWRFEPGRMHLPGSDSCPVNVIASIEVEFRLPRGNK
jgi:TonB family protein